MFWTIDYDDFDGKFCNQGKYPLLTGVKEEMYNSMEQLEVTSTPFYPNYNDETVPANGNPQYAPLPNQVASNSYEVPTQSNMLPSTLNSYSDIAPINTKEYRPVSILPEPSLTPTYNSDGTVKKHGNGIIANEQNTYEISKIYETLVNMKTTSTIPTTLSTLPTLTTRLFYPTTTWSTTKQTINVGQETDSNYVCEADGLYVDRENDCRSFFTCLWTKTRNAKKIRFVCPEQTKFSQINKVCDWEWKVTC